MNYADELHRLGQGGRGGDLRAMLEGNFTGPVQPEVQNLVNQTRGDLAGRLRELQDLGIDITQHVDPYASADYFPRQMAPLAKPTRGYGAPQQPLRAVDPRLGAREPILQGIEGGTEGINRLVTDAQVHAGTPLTAAEYVRNTYLGGRADGGKQAQSLVDWARSLDPQYKAAGAAGQELPFFGHHPLADYQSYFERTAA